MFYIIEAKTNKTGSRIHIFLVRTQNSLRSLSNLIVRISLKDAAASSDSIRIVICSHGFFETLWGAAEILRGRRVCALDLACRWYKEEQPFVAVLIQGGRSTLWVGKTRPAASGCVSKRISRIWYLVSRSLPSEEFSQSSNKVRLKKLQYEWYAETYIDNDSFRNLQFNSGNLYTRILFFWSDD